MFKLVSFICEDKLLYYSIIHKWKHLSQNEKSIHYLNEYGFHYNKALCSNPSAIHIIEKKKEFIDWHYLSMNKNAIHLLKQNKEKICYTHLCYNINN